MGNFRSWKKRVRGALVSRFLDSRFGRRLLIENIGPRVVGMTIDAGDHLMSFSTADLIGKRVFWKGHFERETVDRLLSLMRARGVLREQSAMLEIGGNIGTHTVYFALSGAFAKIVSVEPDPRNFRLLDLNIRQNGLEDRVSLANCAAGETAGEIDFFQNPANHGMSSALRTTPQDRKITVPVQPVGAILSGAGVAPDQIGLIWMDIEGYEPIACRSMTQLLKRRTPLYMEYSPGFYGAEGTEAFIGLLASFYEDCLILEETGEQAVKVTDLPRGTDQRNILFLP